MRKTKKSPGEKIVQDIKRATRRHYSAEEKIRIVLDGLRGDDSIAEICRREGISQGFKKVDAGTWLIRFMHYDLGYIYLEQKTLQTIDNPFDTKVSPMS